MTARRFMLVVSPLAQPWFARLIALPEPGADHPLTNPEESEFDSPLALLDWLEQETERQSAVQGIR